MIKDIKDQGDESKLDLLKNIPIWRKIFPGSMVTVNLHDTFKIGNLYFYVSGLKFANPNLNSKNSELLRSSTNKLNHKYLHDHDLIYENFYDYQCRICLNSNSSHENFLLTLCKCTGSVKYTHYDCLLAWIFSRSDFIEKDNSFIIKTKIYCEICKTTFPSKIF
jgi:hypothetical protein